MTQPARPMDHDVAQAFAGARWIDVLPRRVARPEIPADVLLHAGPPFRTSPPAPVLHAAIQALMFEGAVTDDSMARSLLASGAVRLRPAQDFGIVTPLAQVVSASMPLAAVRHHAEIRFGALVEGSPPALRFGSTAPECRQRLEALRTRLIEIVGPSVRRSGVDLADVVRAAVAAGEDCHSRTAVANHALLSELRDVPAELAEALHAIPAFVLPVLMAAAAAALAHHRSRIQAVGANGEDFGIRTRTEDLWRHSPATPPIARSAAVTTSPRIPLPAIGDSVVIDFCGLGGLIDDPARRMALLDPLTGVVDPDSIVASGLAPRFNLAILEATGLHGLIERGSYLPPIALFSGSG